jgi:hypothetical protein
LCPPARDSEFPEVKIITADAEVFDEVGDDAAGYVARMPRKRANRVNGERLGLEKV